MPCFVIIGLYFRDGIRLTGYYHPNRFAMRILVVEDNQRVARFIIKGLSEEGYAVDHADQGDDALTMARRIPYDCIILDIMLPGLDGFSISSRLRQNDAPVPILMLSARNSLKDKIYGFECGADDFLTKPFAYTELSARVRALIRRKDGSGQTCLSADDLTLDFHARRVERAGTEIKLTRKEFALLEFLLRNKDRIVTRTAVLEHVWDMHFIGDTNIVDVYIRRLRIKVDEGFERSLIHTIRGVGYVLKE